MAFSPQILGPAQETDVNPCSLHAWITSQIKSNKDVLLIQSPWRQGFFVGYIKDLSPQAGKCLRFVHCSLLRSFYIFTFFCALPQAWVFIRKILRGTTSNPAQQDSTQGIWEAVLKTWFLNTKGLRPFHRVYKVTTIFIMTLRCYLPFSQSRHSHW